MLTNPTNIFYATQIASIFCAGDNLCKGSVKARLVNNLSDQIFELHFLPELTHKRFYVGWLGDYVLMPGYRSYNFYYQDLITGVEKTVHMQAGATWSSLDFLNGIPNNLSSKGFDLIGGNPQFQSSTFGDKRIYSSQNEGVYGIAFTQGGTQIAATAPDPNEPKGTPNFVSYTPPPETPGDIEMTKAEIKNNDFSKYLVPAGIILIALFAFNKRK